MTAQGRTAGVWTSDMPREFAGVPWDQIIRDGSGQPICSVFVAGWSKKQAKEHADKICHAVNNIDPLTAERDRLRKALEGCQRVLADLVGGDPALSVQHLWAHAVEAETKARTALSSKEVGK